MFNISYIRYVTVQHINFRLYTILSSILCYFRVPTLWAAQQLNIDLLNKGTHEDPK